MFRNTPVSHSIQFKGQSLSLHTGLLAKQATASVLATIGETSVLAAVVVGKSLDLDYLPLQVIYEERMYASGKIKGSRFIKREGRPSDNAVLAGRMIDRSLRSLFDPFIRNDIQVIITVLSVDEVNSPDTLAVLAASSALSLANIKGFTGPVSSVRVGYKQGQVLVNPSYTELESSDLDMIVSGDGKNIMMVEAGGNILDEGTIGHCMDYACIELEVLTQLQNDFIIKSNRIKNIQTNITSVAPAKQYIDYWLSYKGDLETIMYETESTSRIKYNKIEEYKDLHFSNLEALIKLSRTGSYPSKQALLLKINESTKEVITLPLSESETVEIDKTASGKLLSLVDSFSGLPEIKKHLEHALEGVMTQVVKENILTTERRIDGRLLSETRTIQCQIDVLPRTHGSSLFQRGETQVLNVLTLGTNRDAQILDDMEDFEETTKRYIHHYNFPAYSVGETGRYGAPGRREIGHGALAEKALIPVLPLVEDFPYTMRLVSECLGSNGSSSMASVCSSSLSLMAGGVPIKSPVAGVAMGLALNSESGVFKVITDIQGFEDHYADMDFKVAGTKEGITALQLDNKISGLTPAILKQALFEARAARLHILNIMYQEINKPKLDISPFAPRVGQIQVPVEKIGEVVGPSGRVIKSIIAKTDTEIDIDDVTGSTYIYGKTEASVREAWKQIKDIITEYQSGDIVSAKVFRVENYGAFVKINGTEKEGLIHISEASKEGKRIGKITDVLNIGQEVQARIIGINDKGQISLTLKEQNN